MLSASRHPNRATTDSPARWPQRPNGVEDGEAAGADAPERIRDRWRVAAWVLNAALRLLIVAFAVEAALAGDDPRFSAKGIQVRDLVFAGLALTFAFPMLHAARRGRVPYPVWADCLFLSILALDMGGNSLNLYEQGWRFDLVPHTYGPGAGILALRFLGTGWVAGGLIVNTIHVLLEAQEALGDVLFQTRNVHGVWDTITDLTAGLIGSLGVPLVWHRMRQRRTAPWPASGRFSRRDHAVAVTQQ